MGILGNSPIWQLVNKGKLIARGRTAEVYAWGDNQVLKLYFSWWPLEDMEYEARVGRLLFDAGVAVPAVGDLITVEDRKGLIYERIDGPSMLRVVVNEPNRAAEMARVFAQLHADVHRTKLPNLPLQRRRFVYNVEEHTTNNLNQASRQYVLDVLFSLPDGDSLCHGDLHPGNVLMSADGPRTIDWENACAGSPLADVARAKLLLEHFHFYIEAGPQMERLLETVDEFAEIYLQEYVTETSTDRALIEKWRIPVAAARLSEGIEIEEESLRAICTP